MEMVWLVSRCFSKTLCGHRGGFLEMGGSICDAGIKDE